MLQPRLTYFGSCLTPSGRKLCTSEASDLLQTPLSWFADEVAAGRQSALLDRMFVLTELVEAHRYMEANAATGKVVVLVYEN